DHITAVTGIPLEVIVPGPQRRLIAAAAPVDEIVPTAAEEDVRPGGADQRVLPGAAVHGDGLVRERAAALVDANLVVPCAGLHVDRREGVAVEAEVGGAVVTDVHLQ